HLSGSALLLFCRVESEDLALTIPLGLIPIALSGFVLAALQILTTASILIVLLILASVKPFLSAIPGPRGRRQVPTVVSIRPALSAPHSFPLLLIAPVVLLNLTGAVVPEIQFDAINYHLAVSQIYLRSHGFVDLPYFFHSYFYRFMEMLLTFALALHGAAAA